MPVDSLTADVGRIDATRQMDSIRRRWLMIVAFAIIGAVVAGVVTMFLPRTYESTTSVLVAPVSSSTDADVINSRTKGEINLDTEAQIVRSVALAETVAIAIGSDESARDIAEAVSVSVPANSQVLSITFEAGSAEAARAGAEAYAKSYLDQRRAGSEEAIDEAKQALQSQLEVLQEQFTSETTRSRDPALSEVDRAIASSRRDVLVGQISTLDTSLAALTRASVNPGHVLSAANLPGSATSPSLVINVAAGGIVGLLLGLAFAAALGVFDHRVRSPRDIRLPSSVRVHEDVLTSASTADDLDNRVDEEVDQLRLAVDSAALSGPRTVLVAPVGADAGADLIALALGRAYARRLGSAVYAIADPGSPLANELGIDGAGLSDILSGIDNVSLTELDANGLLAVGPGSTPERLSSLLQRPGAIDLMLHMSDTVFVVATPSAHHSAGTQALLGAMDRVVLVGRSGRLDDRELTRVVDSILRAQFTGRITVALVAPDRSADARRERSRFWPWSRSHDVETPSTTATADQTPDNLAARRDDPEVVVHPLEIPEDVVEDRRLLDHDDSASVQADAIGVAKKTKASNPSRVAEVATD